MIQAETTGTINGYLLTKMIRRGAANLRSHVKEVNDLNVFPIPDGDTGDNMLLTCIGGVEKIDLCGTAMAPIGDVAKSISDGMLLSARGNSGVILSQIFEGIAKGLENVDEADCPLFLKVLQNGTKYAYSAVMEPTEGTILTVMREATEYVAHREYSSPKDVLLDFIDEAKRTLEKTPEMLPVLKKAGVVDSGGAGLVYIVEGMLNVFSHGASEGAQGAENNVGDEEETSFGEDFPSAKTPGDALDLNLFTEDSVLEYGYCTEVLVRLMNAKTEVSAFDVGTITDYLTTIGDSVVAFKNGSIVKVHVHTKTPDKVLSFCQRFGEFLKVKIENMSLQHNNTIVEKEGSKAGNTQAESAQSASAQGQSSQGENAQEKSSKADRGERKRCGIVAVASGEGIRNLFLERGADAIVDGGQSMNPSTHDFIDAFDRVNADTIFVLPNNGNVILAAKMAANMYADSKVHVIESHNVGDGYAALSMYNPDDNEDEIASELADAMSGVTTLAVSKSIRDAQDVNSGDYIGFVGKDILCDNPVRKEAAIEALGKLDSASFEICLLIFGKEANEEEANEVKDEINARYPGKEVFVVDGKQDIYDYILILE